MKDTYKNKLKTDNFKSYKRMNTSRTFVYTLTTCLLAFAPIGNDMNATVSTSPTTIGTQIPANGNVLPDNIEVVQKQISISDSHLTFQLDVTSKKKIKFDLPEWVTSVDTRYKKGEKTYRFAATPMPEMGERNGNIVIKSRKGSVSVPIKQNLDLNLQERLAPTLYKSKLEQDGYIIWGASCVKGDDNMYHLFYSRWKKESGFFSWASHSEIAHAVSKNLLGPYEFKNVALPARGKQYWDGTTTHNPTIHKFGDKYYLYYMGNCGDGKASVGGNLNWTHRNSQRIGVAYTSDLNGEWKRLDHPLIDISPEKDAPDHLMTSNPSVTQMPNGKYLVVYKAVGTKKPLPFGGPVVHLAAISDSPTGPFVKQNTLIFTYKDAFFAAEDPYIWTAGDKMYAVVKDNAGKFTHIGRSLALFESADGINWHPSKHPVVSGLQLTWEDGKVQKVANLERPQLYIEDGIIKALFVAISESGDFSKTYNIPIPIKPLQPQKEE